GRQPSAAADFCNKICTQRTSGDVRSSVAIGGKADVARTAHFGRDWPKCDIDPLWSFASSV
ncbi:MAG TPA: hypothetical protein VN833_21390, partial [Candidatus Acidoferrales bacterium]|nr:hypothetical protein [Candidatus Acidoferrales bacterium]